MNAIKLSDTMLELLNTTLRFEYVGNDVIKIKPQHSTSWRIAPEAVCGFIAGGEIQLVTEDEPSQNVRSSEVFLMQPSVHHRFTNTSDTVSVIRCVYFRITLFGTMDVFRFFIPPLIWRGDIATEMAAICDELTGLRTRLMTGDDAPLLLLTKYKHLECKLVTLIVEDSPARDEANRLLDQLHRLSPVLARLNVAPEAFCLTKDLKLEEMAKLADLSSSQFSALFKEALGMSPIAYQGQQHFNQAMSQLAHTDKPIGQIAQEAGFSDPLFFSKAFKRSAQISPRAYRAKMRHGVW